ncbi:MAG: T9SS type A sorting domain-containing protein [Bacteroidales bacterium]|jgi:hypothetical protein|nr:T9SS type A sorting domain-containing protein [Bacteroidales bacterium]
MKKVIFLALITFALKSEAQITLEHVYDSASTQNIYFPEINQLMIIKFEVSGERYVRINRISRTICIYNLNHSLLRTIDCTFLPSNINGTMGDVLYLSENLFDTDTQIEFMYIYTFGSPYNKGATKIVKENGVVIFADTGAAAVHPNWAMQQWPIYNTSQGTKMILSYTNMQAKVFSLSGTLTTDIAEANGLLMQQNGQLSNLYPNPSNGAITLQYELPNGETEGELILYNMQGMEMKRYKIDNTFNDILLDNTQLPAGTYFYQLQTSKGAVGTKKMVIIK